MGQFCFSRVTIEVTKTSNHFPEQFKTAQTLENAMVKFYADNNDGDSAHVNVTDLVYFETYMEFEMHSERTINLEFQLDLLVKYLKSLDIEIEEVNASGYIEFDGGDLFLTNEDF